MDVSLLSLEGFELVDTPGSVHSLLGVTLEEFEEEEAPLQQTFCRQMSSAEFEANGATATEKALEALISHMEEDPSVFMRLLQRRKQEEAENAGVMSFLKSRILAKVQGDKYRQKLVTQTDCQAKVDEVTQGMLMVYKYSLESRGGRYSKRLAAKRGLHAAAACSASPVLRRTDENAPPQGLPPPPAPPLPQGTAKKNWVKRVPPPPPVPPPALTPLGERSIMLNSPSVAELKRAPLRKPSLVNVHQELTASNPLKRLKSTNNTRSPGGTPSKKRHALTPGSLSVDLSTPQGLRHNESLSQVFLRILEQKFRNVRSPSPAMSPGNRSGFSDFSP